MKKNEIPSTRAREGLGLPSPRDYSRASKARSARLFQGCLKLVLKGEASGQACRSYMIVIVIVMHIAADTRLVKICWLILVIFSFVSSLSKQYAQSGDIYLFAQLGECRIILVTDGSFW